MAQQCHVDNSSFLRLDPASRLDRAATSSGDGADLAFCSGLSAESLESAVDLAQLPKDSEKQNGDYEQQELHTHLDSSGRSKASLLPTRHKGKQFRVGSNCDGIMG